MRQIKFRAHKPVHGDDKTPVMTMPFTLGNLQDKEDFDFTNGMYAAWDEFGLEHEDTVVMQFTGLQDKNGVDIYEGDMITSHQFLFDGNEVESIIFGVIGSNDFGWTLGRIKNKFYEDYTGYEPSEGETNLGDFYGLHEESFEVIGNIHENPELLESKK
jgi:uncharacterized phage protein (TIGR01671 family)